MVIMLLLVPVAMAVASLQCSVAEAWSQEKSGGVACGVPAGEAVPVAAQSVVVGVNLPGVSSHLVTMSSATVAGIVGGGIISWADDRLQQDNPYLSLPDEALHVVADHAFNTSTYSVTVTDPYTAKSLSIPLASTPRFTKPLSLPLHCASLEFLEWVVSSPTAAATSMRFMVSPLGAVDQGASLALLRRHCGAAVVNVTAPQGLGYAVGHAFHMASGANVVSVVTTTSDVVIEATAGVVPREAVEGMVTLPVAVGALGVWCNLGGADHRQEVGVGVDELRGLFSTGGSLGSLPVQLVASTPSLTWLELLLQQLFDWSPTQTTSHLTLLRDSATLHLTDTDTKAAELAVYTPGAIIVHLSGSPSIPHGLAALLPQPSSLPMAPSIPHIEAIRMYPDLSQLAYPYLCTVTVRLTKHFTNCDSVPDPFLLAAWASGSEGSDVVRVFTEIGLYPLAMVPESSSALRNSLGEVVCDGVAVLRKSQRSNATIYVLVAVGSACLLLMILITWRWAAQRREFKDLYKTNTLAVETAEAVAVLDFDAVLRKLDNIERPDRIQVTLLSITKMLKEFVKYIPQHVIKSAREGSNFCRANSLSVVSDIGTAVNSDSTTDTSQVSSSPRGSWSNRETRYSIHRRLSGRSHRMVGVTVARPPLITTYSGSPNTSSTNSKIEDFHADFLQWVIQTTEQDTKATIHRVHEDSVLIAWGCLGGDSGKYRMTRTACRVAYEGRGHCGVKVGFAFCGALGSDTIKTFQILGGVMEEADCLSRLAQLTGAGCLAMHAPGESWGIGSFTFVPFFKVCSLTGGRPLYTSLVYDIQEEEVVQEWMYALQEKEELNAVKQSLAHLFEGRDFAKAIAVITAYVNGDGSSDRLARWLKSTLQALKPIVAEGELPPPIEPGVCGAIFSQSGVRLSCCPPNFVRSCDAGSRSTIILP